MKRIATALTLLVALFAAHLPALTLPGLDVKWRDGDYAAVEAAARTWIRNEPNGPLLEVWPAAGHYLIAFARGAQGDRQGAVREARLALRHASGGSGVVLDELALEIRRTLTRIQAASDEDLPAICHRDGLDYIIDVFVVPR